MHQIDHLKISIITVCYNSESTVEDTIKSVISQSYKNIEYIVIDGNSNDKTNDIVSKYSDYVSLHISEPDNGLYDAINKGIGYATGDIVGILNSDDVYFDDNVLSNMIAHFKDNIDGVYGDLFYVKENDLNAIVRKYSSKSFKKSLLRFGLMPAHPSFYIKRELYNTNSLYDTSFPIAADFELICRYIQQGINLKYTPINYIRMRVGGKSNGSFASRISQNLEISRALNKNGIYSNIFLIALKIPFKILSFIIK